MKLPILWAFRAIPTKKVHFCVKIPRKLSLEQVCLLKVPTKELPPILMVNIDWKT